MKLKFYLAALAALATLATIATSCDDDEETLLSDDTEEEVTYSEIEGEIDITVYGSFDGETTYEAIIDQDAGTAVVQAPYYISDTEEIQGDLTQMYLTAEIPDGASFDPSLDGLHDLEAGYTSTLTLSDGSYKVYTFTAEYVYSTAALITEVSIVDYETTIEVTDPEEEGGTGTIAIYKTSSLTDVAMSEVEISVSPWASVSSPSPDEETGYVNLRGASEVTILAQDGETSTTYEIEFTYPDVVSSGSVGYITNLWGFQTYTDDAHGFTSAANRSLAVVGDYLIVSNSSTLGGMLVFDRFSGEQLDLTVNVSGIDSSVSIHAIDSDDADHLVAASFTSTSYTSYTTFTIWVWKDGISYAPTEIFSEDISDSSGYFSNLVSANATTTTYDLGRTLSVTGNITSGDAIVGTVCNAKYRTVGIPFTNGAASTDNPFVSYGATVTNVGNGGKIVYLTTDASTNPEYVKTVAAYGVDYCAEGDGNGSTYRMTAPSSHWWTGLNMGLDVIEFNDVRLIGIQNCYGTAPVYYARLYVADITSISQSSLTSGFIFDSREGDSTGTDNIPGSGYAVTGMTSYYSFTSSSVLGTNGNYTGDVVFGASDDGTAVQAYLITTDNGMFAYEITKFDI